MSSTHATIKPSKVLTWRRMILCVAALMIMDGLIVMWSLSVGSSGVGPLAFWQAWWGGDVSGTQNILLNIRLPRVAFACLVGAGLSLGGVSFQALLRNPLADPYVLGISGGAALGATVALASSSLMAWFPALGVTGMALLGALLALVPLYFVGKRASTGLSTLVLLLSGVMFNAFASALITLHKALVSAQKAQELLFFLMGSLAVEHLSTTVIASCAVVVLLCVVAIWWVARDLNMMSLGDDEALALGVNVHRVRVWVIWWSSVAVAICVAYTGLIGFVGLVVPHALRLLLGPDHRLLIPTSVLAGMGMVTLCDAIARQSFTLFSTTLPVGVITALVGAPLFMFLLLKTTRGMA